MKKIVSVIGAVLLLIAALSGCRTLFGRGHGPVDSIAFLPEYNPGLSRPVTGRINESSDPKNVEMVVPPGTDISSLVATFSLNREASIRVISSGQTVVQQNSQTPNNFQSPVLYSIKDPKDDEPWLYRVVVREADQNAQLAQLRVVDGSPLDPPFNTATRSYSTTVPYASTQVTIEASAQSRYLQKMTIGGRQVRGARASVAVPFSGVDQLTIPIETVAEDQTTTAQYSVTVVRGEPDRNSTLGALRIGGTTLAPAFSPNRTSYSAQVPYAASVLEVSAVPQSRYATISFATPTQQSGLASIQAQGDARTGNGARIAFTGRDHLTLIVIVTAQDGTNSQYSVNITRAAPDRNNSLAELQLPGSTISPRFDPNRLYYNVEVPYNAQQFTVVALPQSPVAQVALAGAQASGDPASPDGATVRFSGTDRMSVTVRVIAQDGSALAYTLSVRRGPPDSNADLSALLAAPGRLSPSFSPRSVTYSVLIPGSAPAAKLTVQTASPYATVSTSDSSISQAGEAANGKVFTVPVNAGQTRSVDLVVTAQDGSQRLYRVNVTREAAPVQPAPKDSNSRLSGIVIAGGNLEPAFASNRLTYQVTVPTSVNRISIFPIAESPKADVTIDGQPVGNNARTIQLQPGNPRILVIQVTAENGSTTRYTVTATRTMPPAQQKRNGEEGGDHGRGNSDQAPGQQRGESSRGNEGEQHGGQPPVAQRPPEQQSPPAQQTPPAQQQPPAQQNPPAGQPQAVRTVVAVSSDGVRVDPHVWKEIRDARDEVGGQAAITVRVADSGDVLYQGFTAVQVRQPGNSPAAVSFDWQSQPFAALSGQQLSIGVSIRTKNGSYLNFSATASVAGQISVKVGDWSYDSSPK
ncbi:cadherin-like beta sandwich domain-containing protein [Salinispira pacifica]